MTHYRPNPFRARADRPARADRTTLWILMLVVVAAVLALTFGDAHGAVSAAPWL